MRPDISRGAMQRIFLAAFDEFCAAEGANIRNGTSERNLCQRLSFPLEKHALAADLQPYRADCEYNRSNDGRLKTIIGQKMESVTITCDLILHSRGNEFEQDNLIAIEMKRASHRQAEKDKDRVRLMALTRAPGEGVWSEDGTVDPRYVCDYVIGYYIELDSKMNKFILEEYVRGALREKYSRSY
jgi:hypothetical protein